MPLREWPAVVAAASVVVVVEVGLRALGLSRLSQLLGVRLGLDDEPAVLPSAETVLELPPRAWRQLRATRRVMRHWPFGDTCLRRAMVSGQRLRRLQPTLRIGVAKLNGEFQAHAWLEIGGASLDPGAAVYQTLEPVRGEAQS
jgi:hypothetical protein